MDVRYYITKTGTDVVDEWVAGLADDRAEARIFARIERLSRGNFGDHKSLGGGLFELRIDTGPAGLPNLLRDDRPHLRVTALRGR
jgi:putative addiction module killer protein